MQDDLTPEQLQELGEAVRALALELEASLEAAKNGAQPVALDQSSVGRLSRVDALQQQAMAQATRHNLQVRLTQCRAAIDALSRDDYGNCRRCEEPIGYGRLSAAPEARFCIDCSRGERARA